MITKHLAGAEHLVQTNRIIRYHLDFTIKAMFNAND